MPEWLVVTPARNEASRLPALAASLSRQSQGLVAGWIIVDDGSSDDTATLVPRLQAGVPIEYCRREEPSGLARGAAWAAFKHGASRGLGAMPEAQWVVKIDADVVLDDGYFLALASADPAPGVAGGTIVNERERVDHVRGALKAYHRDVWPLVAAIPSALGWDAVDEVILRHEGHAVTVVREACARLTRDTGASEGRLSGRRRGGVVSRWSGYHPVYFALRLGRYAARKPYITGSCAMAYGWLTAGRGPYDDATRELTRATQAALLKRLVRSPRRYWSDSYGA